MKITAGLGSIDDYISFVEAGAEELFCGYVPAWWTKTYGIFSPLNRREVLYYNVQIGSRSEMEILHDMIETYHVPVSITLNALSYRPEQYPLLVRYVEECLELGFSSFIVADLALLVYFREQHLNERIQLTISGELSEMNAPLMDLLADFQVKRVIFHRKMTPAEMKRCTAGQSMEFEAFALNEKCHFHGGLCNSLHCDEMAHLCQVPYRLVQKPSELDCNTCNTCNTRNSSGEYNWDLPATVDFSEDIDSNTEFTADLPGATGCGLCALWDLRDTGVTYLKLVGRGNYSEDMIRDISVLRKALAILETAETREAYIREMKSAIFPYGCSGNCYY